MTLIVIWVFVFLERMTLIVIWVSLFLKRMTYYDLGIFISREICTYCDLGIFIPRENDSYCDMGIFISKENDTYFDLCIFIPRENDTYCDLSIFISKEIGTYCDLGMFISNERSALIVVWVSVFLMRDRHLLWFGYLYFCAGFLKAWTRTCYRGAGTRLRFAWRRISGRCTAPYSASCPRTKTRSADPPTSPSSLLRVEYKFCY